jgi:hypothetical protein
MDGQYLPDDEIDIDSLASSEPPEYVPQMFSEGGEVEDDIEHYAKGGDASLDQSVETMNKYLLADEADTMPTAYATTPYGATQPTAPEMSTKTAKLMLKQLSTKSGGGKSKRSKEMSLEAGDLSPAIPELGAPQTEQEKLTQIASARAQYDALEKAYKLKAQAAQRAGKGLMKPTFNTVMFDQPTLEKPGPLMARTFQLGGLVSKALKSGAKKGASSVDNVVPSSARSLFPEQESSLFPSIIKEEGGNWMGGSTSPEAFVKPLYKSESLDNPNKAKALNKWIDKKLTPYIKNKMGTPSDPVRIQAEKEGILPFPDTVVNAEITSYQNRIAAGLPIEQQAPISKTDRGQAWENRADASIRVGPYQDMVPFGYSNDPNETLRAFGGDFAVQNPTAKVSAMNTGRGPEDLGFDHIVDVLQENLTTGRLSPDSLRGLSMEDAVRLTYQYDLDMAKKMAEAKIQSLEGVPVYKQYPEQGFRWMQLDKPGYFAAESDAMGHSVRGYEPPPGHPDWTPQSGNKGTPGYGYGGWEAIKSGEAKIYSLADSMGKRYTTIEQVPGTHPLGTSARGNNFPDEIRYGGSGTGVEESIPEEKLQEIYALGKKMYFENPNAFAENRLLSGAPPPSPMDSFQKAADMVLGKRPPSINQIKGPVNGYIEESAQPFVQDFLNSGNWSTVNNLNLAKLRDLKDSPEVENFVKSNQLDNRRFLTEAEYKKYETDFLREELTNQLGGFDPLEWARLNPEGMAKGGMVQHFDGGGMAMLSPEESDSYSAEPAQFVKDLKSDYARLKASPTAREQLAKIAALQISQGGPDLAALGVEYLIDPLKSATLDKVFTRPKFRSVLDKPANPKSPRIADQPQREPMLGSLSDALRTKDGNFIGSSEDVIKRAQDAKLMGPSRFSPLTEAGASLGLGLGSFAAKPTAKFLGKEAARQVERGMFSEGPLRNVTPQPMFAVRPEGGGTTFTGIRAGGSNAPISRFDKIIDAGANPSIQGLSNEMGDAIENFWRSKAQNYFTRQYGTPSDPIFKQIISGQLRTPGLQKSIPDYAIEQTKVGKTRIDPVTGESRFYPKYPQALEDLTRRYDEQTGLKGIAFNVNEPIFDPGYQGTMGDRGRQLEAALKEGVTEKMVAGGMNPSLVNPDVSLTGPRGDTTSDLLNYVPSEYKELYSIYKQPPSETNMLSRIYNELGLSGKSNEPGPGLVPENLKRAIETSEPIYDINFSYKSPLKDLLAPENINRYLSTLTPSEVTKMRFEDVVKNSAKYNLDMFNTQNLVEAIRSGKRVPDKVWKQGLSEPLMTAEKEGEKFTWHRIVDNEATALEGAYLGHSVGGYAKGGSYGPKEYRRFKEGEKEVYTLRDARGKPFTTVEVEKAYTGPLDRTLDEREIARMKAEGRELGPMSTIVRQIKGNGAKTGNVAPKDVGDEVLTFLRDYIKPDKITESENYLTPKLEQYKMDLSGRPRP